MPADPLVVNQMRDPQYFDSTNYIVDQRADGSRHWTLTGQIRNVPFTIPAGQSTRRDKVHLYLTLPGIGSQWVKLGQWAPYVTGLWVQSYRVLDPTNAIAMLAIECECEAHAGTVTSPGPWSHTTPVPTAILNLGYVVHVVGTLVNPPGIP